MDSLYLTRLRAGSILFCFLSYVPLSTSVSTDSSRCACGAPAGSAVQQSGNITIAAGQWCWQAALQNEAGSVFCTAVLIDRQYLITPGQCIYGRQANTTFVRIGTSDVGPDNYDAGSQFLAVDDLFVHQGYLNVDTRNDYNIGIIKLQGPLDCSKSVCIACLPRRSSLNASNTCTASSWNVRTASGAPPGSKNVSRPIHERSASIMDQIDCETKLRADPAIHTGYQLSDTKFCLQETDNTSKCTGDLGDPLICSNDNVSEVVGLNTLGFSCFRPSLPSFYVRVSAFVDWINRVLEHQPPAPPSSPAEVSGSFAAVAPLVISAPSAGISNTGNASPVVGSLTVAHPPATNSRAELVSRNQNGSGNATASQNGTMPLDATLTTTAANSSLVVGHKAVQQSVVGPGNGNPAAAVHLNDQNTNTGNANGLVVVANGNGAGNGNGNAQPQTASGTSSQHIETDGSLTQTAADGSVQRQRGLQKTDLLTQVSPNVFQANIGGQTISMDMNTGPKIIFPSADTMFGNMQTRQKRDNVLDSLTAGLARGLSSYTVPVITISASDANYDHNTGKFVFNLPNGTTAFSSINFLPSTAEDIKQQIIDQQDKILAQVDNYKHDILVALNNNAGSSPFGATIAQVASPLAASVSGSGTSARASSSGGGSVSVSVSGNAPSTRHPWSSIYGKKSTVAAPVGDDYDYTDDNAAAPVPVVVQVVKSRPAVASHPVNLGSRNTASSAASAGGAAGASGLRLDNGGAIGATVKNDQPSQGSFSTSLAGPNGGTSAAAGFKGDRVSAQTRNTANSASSNVIATSG